MHQLPSYAPRLPALLSYRLYCIVSYCICNACGPVRRFCHPLGVKSAMIREFSGSGEEPGELAGNLVCAIPPTNLPIMKTSSLWRDRPSSITPPPQTQTPNPAPKRRKRTRLWPIKQKARQNKRDRRRVLPLAQKRSQKRGDAEPRRKQRENETANKGGKTNTGNN